MCMWRGNVLTMFPGLNGKNSTEPNLWKTVKTRVLGSDQKHRKTFLQSRIQRQTQKHSKTRVFGGLTKNTEKKIIFSFYHCLHRAWEVVEGEPNESISLCATRATRGGQILLFLGEALVYIEHYSVGHYPNTALFNPPPKYDLPLSGEWPKLFRKIIYINSVGH